MKSRNEKSQPRAPAAPKPAPVPKVPLHPSKVPHQPLTRENPKKGTAPNWRKLTKAAVKLPASEYPR